MLKLVGITALPTILLGSLCLAMSSSSASATLYCEVAKTRDGFVALRDSPKASGKLLVKMKRGDKVQIGEGRKKRWTQVYHWTKAMVEKQGQQPGDDYSQATKGWVNDRLIEDCG